MIEFPLAAMSAYQDLLEAHRLHAISQFEGTPFLKTSGRGGGYWYTRQRIGDRVVDRYLGPDTAARRIEIEAARVDVAMQKSFERRASRLVAQLRAAGLPALDRSSGKVLGAMARVGTFRLGGTLVGTHAFRLYSAEFGVRLETSLGVTEDLDIAAFENLKLVIHERVDPSFADTFGSLGLTPVPGLSRKPKPTRWSMPSGGTIVDFLVPKMSARRDVVFLPPLGVHAQALSFLNFLIAEPISAVGLYRSGVLLQIPSPERYAIHKLIVAQRRDSASAAKAKKDLAQAEALIRVLVEDRPHTLAEAYENALGRGPKWRTTLDRSLKQRPNVRELLESVA